VAKSGKTTRSKGGPAHNNSVKSYRKSKQKLHKLRQNLLERERKVQELERKRKFIKKVKNMTMLSASVALLVMTYYFIF